MRVAIAVCALALSGLASAAPPTSGDVGALAAFVRDVQTTIAGVDDAPKSELDAKLAADRRAFKKLLDDAGFVSLYEEAYILDVSITLATHEEAKGEHKKVEEDLRSIETHAKALGFDHLARAADAGRIHGLAAAKLADLNEQPKVWDQPAGALYSSLEAIDFALGAAAGHVDRDERKEAAAALETAARVATRLEALV